ncbi:MAG TPA: VOC family protein [Acidobacteriaceae bacterium]|nr:VOC family protein [Acidobacteriaceae bacterium]
MARVTGIGGVFLRARDPKSLTEWYATHLGIKPTAYGVSFIWSECAEPEGAGKGMTAWSLFPVDTKYFGPGTQQMMVNYRVDDLDALLDQLRAADVEIDPKREDYDYGRFAWIVDPEGNRVELWQPLSG